MTNARLLFSLALVAAACGGPQGPAQSLEMRRLSEARAQEIIAELLTDQQVDATAGWTIAIGHDQPLDVDFRLAGGRFGIEWVSEQDRADYGDALPQPADGGQLRIMPGHGSDQSAQILILDHVSYDYANEREHVQRGVTGASETEERLRRDVLDFLEFVRGQGGP